MPFRASVAGGRGGSGPGLLDTRLFVSGGAQSGPTPAQLIDKSGHSRNLTTERAAADPLAIWSRHPQLNGKPVIAFRDGESQRARDLGSVSYWNQFHQNSYAFAEWVAHSYGDQKLWGNGGTTTNQNALIVEYDATNRAIRMRQTSKAGGGTTHANISTDPGSIQAGDVLLIEAGITASTATLRVKRTRIDTAPGGGTVVLNVTGAVSGTPDTGDPDYGFAIGSDGAGAAGFCSGTLGALVVTFTTPDAGHLAAARAWFAAQYDFTPTPATSSAPLSPRFDMYDLRHFNLTGQNKVAPAAAAEINDIATVDEWTGTKNICVMGDSREITVSGSTLLKRLVAQIFPTFTPAFIGPYVDDAGNHHDSVAGSVTRSIDSTLGHAPGYVSIIGVDNATVLAAIRNADLFTRLIGTNELITTTPYGQRWYDFVNEILRTAEYLIAQVRAFANKTPAFVFMMEPSTGIPATATSHEQWETDSYNRGMLWVADQIRALGASVRVVDLHGSPSATPVCTVNAVSATAGVVFPGAAIALDLFDVSGLTSHLPIQLYRDGVVVGGETTNLHTCVGADCGPQMQWLATPTTYAGSNPIVSNALVATPTGRSASVMLEDFDPSGLAISAGLSSFAGARGLVTLVQATGAQQPTVEDRGETFTAAANDLITYATDWPSGRKVRFTTTGTLPGGLSLATDYWIVRQSATTSKVAASLTNAILGVYVDIIDVGTGTHTVNLARRVSFSGSNRLSSSATWDLTAQTKVSLVVAIADSMASFGYVFVHGTNPASGKAFAFAVSLNTPGKIDSIVGSEASTGYGDRDTPATLATETVVTLVFDVTSTDGSANARVNGVAATMTHQAGNNTPGVLGNHTLSVGALASDASPWGPGKIYRHNWYAGDVTLDANETAFSEHVIAYQAIVALP